MDMRTLLILSSMIATGVLLGGFQSAMLYYGSPGSYGFHHIQNAYVGMMASLVFFASLLVAGAVRRINRRVF